MDKRFKKNRVLFLNNEILAFIECKELTVHILLTLGGNSF